MKKSYRRGIFIEVIDRSGWSVFTPRASRLPTHVRAVSQANGVTSREVADNIFLTEGTERTLMVGKLTNLLVVNRSLRGSTDPPMVSKREKPALHLDRL